MMWLDSELRVLLLLAVGSLFFAAAAPDAHAQAAVPAESTRAPAAPTTPVAPGASASKVAPDYKIGPGDGLSVFVFNHPELSMPVPVRPDGKLSMPLVEDLPAAGKTPNELARDVEERLKEFLRAPRVSIMVTSFVGGDQVRVIGAAAEPRAVPYRANMTLLDVMIEVGGLEEFAAGNRAKVVRNGPAGGKPQEIRVRLNDLVKKGDVRRNIPMQPGDIIIIPESRF
jgi:polysaccharide biosynthesis/export protein